MRQRVPDDPDFSSRRCAVTDASEAHHPGHRPTLSGRPLLGFPPIRAWQGYSSHLEARFRVARLPLHKLDWVEGGVAAPSALRSMASLTTGTTLQRSIPVDWRSAGTEVYERVWGWQPRHIQESVWTTNLFTDRTVILTVIPEITIRAPVIGLFIARQGNRYAYVFRSSLSIRALHYR